MAMDTLPDKTKVVNVTSVVDDMELSSDTSMDTQCSFVDHQKTQQQRYQCSQCDKCFETSKLLRKHFLSHTTDEFPYKCGICGEGFMDLLARKGHNKEHKAGRQFKCSDCRRSFIVKTTLQSHRCRGFSDKPKPFKCNHCEKSFSKKENLMRDLCGKQYSQRSALDRQKMFIIPMYNILITAVTATFVVKCFIIHLLLGSI